MTWSGAEDAPPTARIAAMSPSLKPSEQRVVEEITSDIAGAVELTAQQLADQAGIGRATVIRTAQRLGYEGFPQLRVALALEVARLDVTPADETDDSMLGSVRRNITHFGSRLEQLTSALTEDDIASFVMHLDRADHVLVVGNGLSAPLSLDLTLRLNTAGRPAEYIPDALGQRIRITQLTDDDACVVISGSGANNATLELLPVAAESGVQTLALTSFSQSALVDSADVAIVVPPVEGTFQGELLHTSRVALALVAESLVGALVTHRGDRGTHARALALSVVSRAIAE